MGAMSEKVDELKTIPTTTVGRISDGFDTGVATVLHKLGVPSKKEIGTLTRRVEELTRTLESKPARVRRASPRRTAADRKAVATA